MKKMVLNMVLKMYNYLEKKSQKRQYAQFKSNYDIDESVKFNGNNIRLYGDGQIIINENTYIGEMSYLQSSENQVIKIGSNCAISHNVKMYTCSYHADQSFNQIIREQYYGDITVGNGVWIGVNVYISPGVSIGDNSVIGANSVVTKDIPSNAIYGGIPAKLIRFKGD